MKAQDLRIGNYVNFKNRNDIYYCEVQALCSNGGIDINRYFKDGIDNDWQPEVIDNITPIPLTEEWLIKFGFEKNIHGVMLKLGNCTNSVLFFNSNSGQLRLIESNCKILTHDGLKYVHQLQNLYFALTNEELTV